MVGIIDKVSSNEDQHTGDATCLLYHDEHVFSGGADGRIKIWTKDLLLIRDIADAHDSYIYTLAVCPLSGRLYSSSNDGTIRYFDQPIASRSSGSILMRTQYDEIIALFCTVDEADATKTVLWSGDDKGVIIKWIDGRISFKYNMVEEVRSMWVENSLLYTARDLDVVITDVGNSKTGQYVTTCTIPGRAPLALIGEQRWHEARIAREKRAERRQWLAFTTRDGRGVQLVHNSPRFETVWLKNDVHEMIINALCGNDKELFTAGYDGHVMRWTQLESTEPVVIGDVLIGSCVNALCTDAKSDGGTVYVADTRGSISRVTFGGGQGELTK